MQMINTIAHRWLSEIEAGQMETVMQVVETNSSDALGAHIVDQADKSGIKVFNIEFQSAPLCDPLDLFYLIARWFGDSFGHDWIESQIEDSCYSLHARIVKAWYHREHYFRSEPLLFDQAGYEELEFFQGIERLLDRFAQRQPFIVLISHINLAPDIVLSALGRWLQGPIKKRHWGGIGFLQQARRAHNVKTSHGWQECLRHLERQELIIPIQHSEKAPAGYSWYRPSFLKGFKKQQRMLIVAADTFAYRDVIAMVERTIGRCNDQQAGQLLFLSAYSSMMSGELDMAVRNFVQVQNFLQSTNTEGILTGCYYWQAMCYTHKTQERLAREAQEQCEKLAQDYSDQRWYALSRFAAFYIDSHLAQHQLTHVELRALDHLLNGQKYENLLATINCQVTIGYDADPRSGKRQLLKNCVQALRLSRRHCNQLGVASALHAMGTVHMRVGNYSQTQRLYELSLRLRERFQSKADMLPVLNAFGYFLISQEDWQKSWSMFDRALSLLIENRNFNEASITLYNLVWLYLQSGDVQQALSLMNDLLELMRIREVDNVPYRNIKDLYILKGWLHILLRQPIQARYCLVRMQSRRNLHETEFTKALRFILSGRLSMTDHELPLAVRDTQRALKCINESTGIDIYMLSLLKLEVARLFMDLGHKDLAKPVFTELRHHAHERQLDTLAQRVSRASLGISYLSDTHLPPIAQPYQVLMEIAQKETQLSVVHEELAQYQQLSLLIELSTEAESVEVFLAQVIDVLDRRVPANEFAIFLNSSAAEGYPLDLLKSNDVEAKLLETWRQKLLGSPKRNLSFRVGDEECLALPLSLEALEHGWLVISGDAQQRQVWNQAYLTFFSQQLGLILDRMLREAYLEHRNKTDLLTGILNRAGLFDRLQKQFAQLKRYPKQGMALCYFDLDHFKYFNDHFGHELGDGVLKKLVRSVGDQLRGRDEFSRLGGDEFVIIFPETDRKAVGATVERLRKTLAEPDWWLPLVVGDSEEQDNPVPRSEWISASFGVVIVDHWPKGGIDQTDLLAQADKAMYQAKNDGRDRVVISTYLPAK